MSDKTQEAIALLEEIDTHKLNDLSLWLDIKDTERGQPVNGEVQRELRKYARLIDQALGLLRQPVCKRCGDSKKIIRTNGQGTWSVEPEPCPDCQPQATQAEARQGERSKNGLRTDRKSQ